MYYKDVFLLKPEDTDVFEIKFGYDFSKKYIEKNMQCKIKMLTGKEKLRDLNIDTDIAFFIFDPTSIPSIYVRNGLTKIINSGYKIATCVTNETNNKEQQAKTPYIYHNISTFNEVAEIIFKNGSDITTTEKIDPFLFAVDVNAIDLEVRVKDIPGLSLPKAVSKNILVHRFGENIFFSSRDDLIPFVPDNSKKILDIGCGMGGFGKNLKQHKKEIEITGIELARSLAKHANKYYNRVIVVDVLNVELDDKFDLIVCADLIEHVYDPWKLLKKINSWLMPDGYLLSCVPNIGHWSIVKDLLEGKFEYILVGLLCVGHIRFFTEESLKDMLHSSGFTIDLWHKNTYPPTPEGENFLRTIKGLSIGNIDGLNTFSFIFRAKKTC